MLALTEDRPKGMITLAGRTLIEWQLDALRGAGLDMIGVVGGYMASALERYDFSGRFENPRWAATNMVRSLETASDWLDRDTCVVSYSDIFYGVDSVRRLIAANGDIVVPYDPNWRWLWSRRFADPLSDAESFEVTIDGRLLDIGGKPTSLDAIQGQYMGLLKVTSSGWRSLAGVLQGLDPMRVDRLDMTSLLKLCLQAGVPICAVAIGEQWGEVDSEADLQLYEDLFRTGELIVRSS